MLKNSFFFFIEACFYGNFEIVKVLVENGANVNGNQTDERSPGEKTNKKRGFLTSNGSRLFYLLIKKPYFKTSLLSRDIK